VPVGVPGELYLGGPGVALGYLNRPGLTAQRFVPDPFSPVPGAAMYRSGDRVRWRADGQLEFLGRRDHQVKLRGYRIEPGEIEAVLRQQPGVGDAVVVVRRGPTGEERLLAYVQAVPGMSPQPADLQVELRSTLPAYMLPAAVVVLEKFPLNLSGKIDRAALPDPAAQAGWVRRPYTAPRNETERLLAGVWARILRQERVGIHDNFYDLGGASVQVLEVVSLAGEMGLQLAPETVFRYQTVAELAEACQPGVNPAAGR
jgi:hypothetical protein